MHEGRQTPRSAPHNPVPRGCRIKIPDLRSALDELLRQVPRGRVTTYGDLARALGDVAAARWVATCLLDPGALATGATHRVVRRDGALGEFATGQATDKVRLLAAERILVQDQFVDLQRYGFKDFVSSRPLRRLARSQDRLASKLLLRAPADFPRFVAGVDVSYRAREPEGEERGVAAYALVDVERAEPIWSLTIERPILFPYIPGYLAFRELPILLELLKLARQSGRLADVVLVDGNGILHHRRAGIASQLGVAAGLATIGVGKSLLCGSVDLEGMRQGEMRPVVHEGNPVGLALKTSPRGRPIFVSPGHLVDVPFAGDLATRLIRRSRIPVPIAYAHAISRSAARKAACCNSMIQKAL